MAATGVHVLRRRFLAGESPRPETSAPGRLLPHAVQHGYVRYLGNNSQLHIKTGMSDGSDGGEETRENPTLVDEKNRLC